ncbi:MAG TPA: lysylphosphatidylglycerol synthase domain-containing protein [Anaeromyxobacter sp.]|nr:lysylphosphatidylglycerol synthase domain-containing protein [Anaeromyxobacter sp.]
MPWRKRLLVVAIAAGAAAPLVLAGARLRAGAPLEALAWAAAFAAVALALLHAFWPAFDLARRTLRRGPRGARLVALTFDDGPSDDTPAVLDALERAAVRATFFVLGEAAERRADLVREIHRRGHAVALHGHTHAPLVLAGPARVARELDRCRAAVRAAGVEPAPWFRAPHGWKGPFLGRALRARGLRLVAWTRGVWDTERPGADVIADRASRRPRGGEILLLHDGCGTPGLDPRRDQTAAAVPEIARRWRAAGFEFAPLDALAGAPGAGPAPPRAAGGRGEDAPGPTVEVRPPSRALRAAGLLVALACAAVAARRVDLSAVLASLSRASPALLLGAAAANLCAIAAHASRWRAVVRAPGVRVRWRDAAAALLAGFAAGIVLPARGSDVLRAHLLARRAGISTASVIAASALDHVVGATALVVAASALAPAVAFPSWAVRGLAAVGGIAAVAGGAAWLLGPRHGRVPRSTGAGARLRAGLAAVREPRALLAAVGWGLAGWVAETAIALATLAALGLPPTLAAAALAVVAASAAAAIQLAPGNAGSFELATALAVGGTGIAPDAALAFAVAFHAVHLVPVAVLGGPVLVREALRGG